MAAGVAAAFAPDATVESVVAASTENLLVSSGREMRDAIDRAQDLASEVQEYKRFRAAVYERADEFFQRITCDSRETVPVTLALFSLARGDVEKCVTYGANFGRDADTIASMCGALGGALMGVDRIRPDWVRKAHQHSGVDQEKLAADLVQAAIAKHAAETDARRVFASLLGNANPQQE